MLAAKHQQLPPTINFGQLNEHIDLRNSPFYINRQLREWKPGSGLTRQAAISSFGFSGTNAHIVVGEYQPPVEVKPPASIIAQGEKTIIPLSARTAEQLRQKARDLLGFIRAQASAIDLVEMAYTLQTGRVAMEERLGFVVNSVEQLAEKLEACVNGESGIKDFHQGQVKRNSEEMALFNGDADLQRTIDQWMENGKFSRLLEVWVKGLEPDWNKLYGEARPKRMNLPLYPFAKDRYWMETTAGTQISGGGNAEMLHPLVHRNTSDLSGQRYSSTFTGEEFFFADRRVAANGHAGQKVLPAVAYLEMARAAIDQALPSRPESTGLELRNTVWVQPIVVTGKKQVRIALSVNDDGVDYEIYSQDTEQRLVHCQGRAVLNRQPLPAKLDIEQLKGQISESTVEPDSVYATCDRMGLVYG